MSDMNEMNEMNEMNKNKLSWVNLSYLHDLVTKELREVVRDNGWKADVRNAKLETLGKLLTKLEEQIDIELSATVSEAVKVELNKQN